MVGDFLMIQIYDYWTTELQKNSYYKVLTNEKPDLVRSFIENEEIRQNFNKDITELLKGYFEEESTYQNIIRKINTVLNPQYCLSYYCSTDTAVSLLGKTQFWLCNTEHMNDYGEIDYGLNCLRKILKKNEQNISKVEGVFRCSAHEFMKSFEEKVNSLKSRTYLMSFSNQSLTDENGKLSMWSRYGNNGIYIMFNKKIINKMSFCLNNLFLKYDDLSMCKLSDVIYSTNPDALLGLTVKNCLDYIRENASDYIMGSVIKDIYYYEWMYCLLHGACILKHKVFSEEAESRLFITCQDSLDKLKNNNIVTVDEENIKGKNEKVIKIDFGEFVNADEFNLSWNDFIKRIVIWKDRDEDVNVKKEKIIDAICNGKIDNAIVRKIEVLDMPYRKE